MLAISTADHTIGIYTLAFSAVLCHTIGMDERETTLPSSARDERLVSLDTVSGKCCEHARDKPRQDEYFYSLTLTLHYAIVSVTNKRRGADAKSSQPHLITVQPNLVHLKIRSGTVNQC